MAILGEVTFELQHFQASDGALRIVGRWHGMRVRGFQRPVLTVTIAGEDRRLDVLPGEHNDAEDGGWFAAFAWRGDPRSITAAELQVGRRVVVTLPPPHCPENRRQDYEAAAEPAGRGDDRQAKMSAPPFELPSREKLAPLETERDSALKHERRELRDARGERDAARPGLDSARPELRHLRGELKKLQEELKESQSDAAAQRDRAERVCVELQAAERRHLEQLARLRAERSVVETRRSDIQALESALASAREDAEHSRASVQALQERLARTRGETRGAPTRGGRRSSRGLSLRVVRAPMALRGVRRGIARAEVGMFLLVLVLGFAVAWLVVHLP